MTRIALALLFLAAPLAAQTPADSLHAKQVSDTASYLARYGTNGWTRRMAGFIARQEAANLSAIGTRPTRVDTVRVTVRDTVRITRVDTVYVTKPDSVIVAPVVATIDLRAARTSIAVGSTTQVTALPKDVTGLTLLTPVSFSASPLSVGKISGTGIVTGLAGGVVTVIAKADTVVRSISITVVAPLPPPPDTSTATKIGPATVAELPRLSVDVTDPGCSTTVRVGTDLQAAINQAAPGACLLLPPGAVYVGNFTLPDKGTLSAWITLRTDTTVAAGRMTPSKAVRLAKIQTPNNVPAIQTALTAHHWRLSALDIGGTTGASEINGIVKLGEGDRSIQTSLATTAHHFVLDRVYVHGTPTQAVRRCINLQSATTAIVDSWLSDCHSNNGDSQGIIGWNGPGPYLIRNNHIEGGHQLVFFGGADPAVQALVPSDITIVGNHLTRPMSWKGTWQAKTLVETKNVRRMLVEGNIVEGVYADGQAGFAFLLKSENQLCSAPYTQSADITVRYNRVRNVAGGFNISGRAGDCTAVPAARILVTDNVVEPFNGLGDGIPVQLLSGATDVVIGHNTFGSTGNMAVSFDGPAQQRLAFHSTVMRAGLYGVKGSGTGSGTSALSVYAPGSLFANNVVVGTDCNYYPATTLCPATVPSTLPLGYDGKPVGADTAKVTAATQGVVIP